MLEVVLLWLPLVRYAKAKEQKKQQCHLCSPFVLKAFMWCEVSAVSMGTVGLGESVVDGRAGF